MDDLCGPNGAVSFIVGHNHANQAIFDKDTSMVSLRCVDVSKAEDLHPAGWLTRSHMTKQKKSTQEVFHPRRVSLDRSRFPKHLPLMVEAKQLSLKPILLEDAIENPSVIKQ
jgi:hypothetical protein